MLSLLVGWLRGTWRIAPGGLRGLGCVGEGWLRAACPRCESRVALVALVARGGRAVPGVMRDICDLSGQPESLQLFLYSGDLG